MAEGETIFTFKADTKPAEQSLESFGDKVVEIGRKASIALAGYFSFRALSIGFEKAVESAMEAERAVNQFNAAMISTGTYTEAASASFEDYASSLERTTGVADDLIMSNAALLVSIGKLEGEGLKRATQAALDLAKGLQIDVGSAFDIVTKATQGNVGMLAKYGLEVSKNATDSQKFGAALSFIESRFSGLAQGNINTFEGALTKLKNGFNDVFESSGKLITQNPKVIAVLSVFGDLFYELSKNIANSNANIGIFIDYSFKIAQFITSFVLAPLEATARFLITTMSMLPRFMLEIYNSLAGVADKIFGIDLQSKSQGFTTAITGILDAVKSPLITDEQFFTTRLSRTIDETKKNIDELAEKLSKDLPNAAKAGGSTTQGAIDGMSDAAKTLATTFKNALVNTIVKGVDHIAQKIVKGEDIFGGLLSVVLMSFGEMAQSIGTVLIGIGIGIESLTALKGFAAIAAGIGLVLIGGIMKALAGSSGGPVTNPNEAAADAVIASGDVYQQTQEEERAAAETGVQVVVQGNIFDSRETGLQIAQIINDSFDLNGTIIRANA